MINSHKSYAIFGEDIDQGALDQFESAMQQPFVVKGALMPDAHLGYSLPIGAVVATEDVVVPAWVGYDIGCGVCAVPTGFKREDVYNNSKLIFDEIYKVIPVGFKHNSVDTEWGLSDSLPRTEKMKEIFNKNGLRQLGSLGGGNHFIEIGADERNQVWIVIHSGSRGIGHAVATHYMKLASGDGKAREGHFGFSTSSQECKDYLIDMSFCLSFALKNRYEMAERVLGVLGSFCGVRYDHGMMINRNHNFVTEEDGLWVHRKGATHAEAGMLGVIPGNMRDGSFIVEGKGNPASLCSSSHGAGRTMGRKQAKRVLDVTSFQESMSGIMAKVGDETLDEAPDAYKNIGSVMDQQRDLVKIVHHIQPIINIKA